VKSKLEKKSGYTTLEMKDNVVGLSKQLKQMTFASEGGSTSTLDTPDCYETSTSYFNQGPREPVTIYYRRFVSTTKVIEEQRGKLYPEKLAVSASDADKNIARDKYLSMICLVGVDKAQFGMLVEDLNNSYLAGNDQYPVLLDGTQTLLPHYQGCQDGEHMDDNKNVSRETTFAQRKPCPMQQLTRICCWSCNEYGNYQSDCSQKKEMHGTQMAEAKEDEGEDGTARTQSPKGWCNGQVRPKVMPHGNENHDMFK
jgi:hypothetical protein